MAKTAWRCTHRRGRERVTSPGVPAGSALLTRRSGGTHLSDNCARMMLRAEHFEANERQPTPISRTLALLVVLLSLRAQRSRIQDTNRSFPYEDGSCTAYILRLLAVGLSLGAVAIITAAAASRLVPRRIGLLCVCAHFSECQRAARSQRFMLTHDHVVCQKDLHNRVNSEQAWVLPVARPMQDPRARVFMPFMPSPGKDGALAVGVN